MKILVRKPETLFYLAVDLQWTPLEEDAFNFPSFLSVLETCTLHKLNECEIIYALRDITYNFSIKMNPWLCTAQATALAETLQAKPQIPEVSENNYPPGLAAMRN